MNQEINIEYLKQRIEEYLKQMAYEPWDDLTKEHIRTGVDNILEMFKIEKYDYTVKCENNILDLSLKVYDKILDFSAVRASTT